MAEICDSLDNWVGGVGRVAGVESGIRPRADAVGVRHCVRLEQIDLDCTREWEDKNEHARKGAVCL